MVLVTFEQVKQFLGLNKPDLSDYPELEFLLESMEAVFEDYCYREFEIKERVQTIIFTTEEDKVALLGVPIVTVASLTVAGDTADYKRSDSVIQLDTIVEAYAEIIVTYTGGLYLDNAGVPKDLNMAAIRQISFEYQNRENIGVTQQIIDGNTNKVAEVGLLKYTRAVLDRYINYSVKQ